jgi:hypothetical protein
LTPEEEQYRARKSRQEGDKWWKAGRVAAGRGAVEAGREAEVTGRGAVEYRREAKVADRGGAEAERKQ